jgi:hypothetical protein
MPALATTTSNNAKQRDQPRVALIERADMFANSVKPRALAEHLRERGFEVRVVESNTLGRVGERGVARCLPRPTMRSLRLYGHEAMWAVSRRLLRYWDSRFTRHLNGMCVVSVMLCRGDLLARDLRDATFDVLICDSGLDQAVVLHRVATKQLLDLPSPWGEELRFANQLSPRSHRRLKDLEERCLSTSDRVSFHWRTYERYVRENYRADVRWLDCSYGVTKKRVRARFSDRPRVVFLGFLRGAWVNLPLLERLSGLYPVDVWGGPPPPKGTNVRYLGYAATLDVLADYQIGLVTISDDPLRRLSFSSKQLEYFSYGLPVLVPAWRSDDTLAPGSLPYTEETFLSQVAALAERETWEATSAAALDLASQLSWESALTPLMEFLSS